jgi:hypothetical protein
MCRKLHIFEFGCQTMKPPICQFIERLINLFVLYRTNECFPECAGLL